MEITYTEEPKSKHRRFSAACSGLRKPMFTTISACPHYLKGYKVADIPAIMGSIDICIGETDK